MSLFDLDTEGQASVAEEAHANAVRADQIGPEFWDGSAAGIGEGVMRGGARAGQFIGMGLLAAPVVLREKLLGEAPGAYSDALFRGLDEHINGAVDYWTPRPEEVGTAGRILGGLAEITLPLMAGGGNPALLLGSQEMGGATDLVRQGVDAGPAVGVGVLEGLASAVGFKVPFLGKALVSKIASGAVGNLAVNAGSSLAAEQLLQATGNEKQATQFDPMNFEARAVDVLTGLVFGGMAHASARNALLTVENAKHFQEDTAPGVPADINSSVAHQAAMENAIHDILEGESVRVPPEVMDAEFMARAEEPVKIPPELKDLKKVPAEEDTVELPTLSEEDLTAKAPVFDQEPEHVMVAAARQRLEQTDLSLPTGEFAKDGSPVSLSARKFMERIDEEVKQARTDAKAFSAAVTCFLGTSV